MLIIAVYRIRPLTFPCVANTSTGMFYHLLEMYVRVCTQFASFYVSIHACRPRVFQECAVGIVARGSLHAVSLGTYRGASAVCTRHN